MFRVASLCLLLFAASACGRLGYDRLESTEANDGGSLDAPNAIDGAGTDAAPAVPMVVATSNFPFAIASDGTEVYWADFGDGSVHKLSSEGTASVELIAPRTNAGVYGLAVANGFVYVCDSNTGEIRSAATSGEGSSLVATSSCRDLAVNDTHLYWTNSSQAAPTIRRLALPGGIPEDLGAPGSSTNLGLAGDEVYWSSYSTGEVFGLNLDGLKPNKLLATTAASGPWGVVASNTHVYVAEHHSTQGAISRVPIGGGSLEVLAANQEGAHELVLDGLDLYWTSEFAGTITRLSPGAPPVVVAEGQDQPLGIAVTGDAIWWTNRGGTVTRMAK